VEWVTTGTPPPASRYPTLASGDLVPATRAAIGLPDIPGLPFNDRILNPVVRYDFGAGFDAVDLSGVMSVVPPRILGVVPTLVPRVNEDGNETAGVPSVQMQAPLGTYLGWNTVRLGSSRGRAAASRAGGFRSRRRRLSGSPTTIRARRWKSATARTRLTSRESGARLHRRSVTGSCFRRMRPASCARRMPATS
jgi:hypothetical protein